MSTVQLDNITAVHKTLIQREHHATKMTKIQEPRSKLPKFVKNGAKEKRIRLFYNKKLKNATVNCQKDIK